MGGKRYTGEFKAEAARQVIAQGRPAREVASRLGVSLDSLYGWVRERRNGAVILNAMTFRENRSSRTWPVLANLPRIHAVRPALKQAHESEPDPDSPQALALIKRGTCASSRKATLTPVSLL